MPDIDVDIQTLLDLLAVPGEPGHEAAIARMIADKLAAMGLPADAVAADDAHRKSEIGGEVGNLIVRIAGRGRLADSPPRMLSSHLDTVPGAVGCRPRLDGQRVVNDAAGRCLGGDARAGCAVLLAAARALLAAADRPPCVLVFFVQEEIGLVGARWLDVGLLGEPRPAMCFNFDGGDPAEVTNAVIGAERLHVTVSGVASHTMFPDRGISAAAIACTAAARMMQGGWHGRIDRPEGRGLANLGVLRGGTGSNVIMPELYALLEARSYDRDFRVRILDAWKGAFRESVEQANASASSAAAGRASVEFRPGPVYDPYRLPEDAPVVRVACDAIRGLGLAPVLIDDDGGQDASWVVAHGIPAVGLGYGDYRAHTPDEYVNVAEFHTACRLAERLALGG